MSSISKGICKSILDYVVKNVAMVPPTAVYVSLHTADPSEVGSSEVNYVGYELGRPQITFSAPAARKITQSNLILFPQCASAGSPTVTHYGLWSAATGGVYLGGGALTNSKIIEQGKKPRIFSGSIEVGFQAGAGTDGTVGISTVFAESLLNYIFRQQPYTRPATLKVALTTTLCNDTSIGTEVSGGSYSRVSLAAGLFPANSTLTTNGAAIINTSAISFTTPTASWGNIKAQAVLDGDSSNFLFYGNDVINQDIAADETVVFQIGDFVLALS